MGQKDSPLRVVFNKKIWGKKTVFFERRDGGVPPILFVFTFILFMKLINSACSRSFFSVSDRERQNTQNTSRPSGKRKNTRSRRIRKILVGQGENVKYSTSMPRGKRKILVGQRFSFGLSVFTQASRFFFSGFSFFTQESRFLLRLLFPHLAFFTQASRFLLSLLVFSLSLPIFLQSTRFLVFSFFQSTRFFTKSTRFLLSLQLKLLFWVSKWLFFGRI